MSIWHVYLVNVQLLFEKQITAILTVSFYVKILMRNRHLRFLTKCTFKILSLANHLIFPNWSLFGECNFELREFLLFHIGAWFASLNIIRFTIREKPREANYNCTHFMFILSSFCTITFFYWFSNRRTIITAPERRLNLFVYITSKKNKYLGA